LEVIPAEVQHNLWLQYCFNDLAGLGQAEELTLRDEDQQDRIDEFIDQLRECRESVEYFDLTLDSLLSRVILPEQDQPIFVGFDAGEVGIEVQHGSACRPFVTGSLSCALMRLRTEEMTN